MCSSLKMRRCISGRMLSHIVLLVGLGKLEFFCDIDAIAQTVPENEVREYVVPEYTEAPSWYAFVPNALTDVPHFLRRADPRIAWRGYLAVLASSGVLIAYDQEIIDESQRFARRVGVLEEGESDKDLSRPVWTRKIGGVDADLRVPNSLNSYWYYLGDGLTSISIIAGLAGFGIAQDNLRALNTASQMAEGLLLTGMFVISSKYSFGRQSPNKSTAKGGLWRPMPGMKTYLTNISSYDAFPSGHVATLMTTVTLAHKNYPEKAWVLPVGYTGIGLLMFAMLNNGVHWAGDYPVGLAIGYLSANTIFDRRKPTTYSDTRLHRLRRTYWLDWRPFLDTRGLGLAVHLKAPHLGFE